MNRVRSAGVPRRRQVDHLALAALVLGGTTIGFAPILVRWSEVGPTATAFWRLVLAVPFMWLWLAGEHRRSDTMRGPASLADYRGFLVSGFFFAGDLAVWHWSLKYTTVANATLLVNFAPVFVTLGSWLLFRQRVTLTFLAGLVTALLGAVLLIGTSFTLSPEFFGGDMLALLAAMFYGGYMLSLKHLRARFPTAVIMAWNGVVMSVLLLPPTLLSGEVLWPVSLVGWLVLVALAVLIHIGGQGTIAYAMAHLPASFSSVTLLVQPLMAAVFAWLLLGETLTPLQVAGGVVVLAGIATARRGSLPA
ncbi:MAG: DMT family transporter [Chloroflexi bacterium]|nr:MAG: DMT family transporter [Chloroflexota bacterium]